MHSLARIVVLALTGACFLTACSRAHRPASRLSTASPGDLAAQGEREQTADEQVKHALNRVGFGARPGDVERVRAMGVDRWIESQLWPEKIEDRATEQFVARFPVLAKNPGELLAEYPQPQQLIREKRREMAQHGEMVTRDSTSGKIGRAHV